MAGANGNFGPERDDAVLAHNILEAIRLLASAVNVFRTAAWKASPQTRALQ